VIYCSRTHATFPTQIDGRDMKIENRHMKIVELRVTPLFCRLKQPYHWAQGVNESSSILLVEVETAAGVTGIGEIMACPSVEASLAVVAQLRPLIVGESIYNGSRIRARCYRSVFATRGTGSAPRYFAQVFAGIELALWDAIGKAAGQPLHRLLGGAVHDQISYFGFIQGDSPEELVTHAKALVEQGFRVFYMKVGRGAEHDIAAVKAVRAAIGVHRLRLDANESWDLLSARRIIAALAPFGIEMIEQPLPAATGVSALAHLRAVSEIPLAGDQSVFSSEEVYDLCREGAVDLITLGLHETGGINAFRKAAAVAEAAGVNICNHGIFESGITTCAASQVLATVPNLDDGNQIMWQLLSENLVKSPSLIPIDGLLPVSELPGLGFELDWDAVHGAAAAYSAMTRMT
jgi:L-alanine-DL-glutamate epimerase-like enolase superfamily enzyme